MSFAILAFEDGCEVLKAVKSSKSLKQQQHDN